MLMSLKQRKIKFEKRIKLNHDIFIISSCSCFQDRYILGDQGQSVGSGGRARQKFSSTGEKAPGYQLSPSYFQKFKRMPAPDWAQKMLCIIVPNLRTVSPEFFS